MISALKADVKVDGRIHVDGRGLLLGGGNALAYRQRQRLRDADL